MDTMKLGIRPVGKIKRTLVIEIEGELLREKELDLTENGMRPIKSSSYFIKWDRDKVVDSIHDAIEGGFNEMMGGNFIVAHSERISILLPDEFIKEDYKHEDN